MEPSALLSFALDVGIRATALLGATALALLALRRASAATRHAVAVAGLAGALLLAPLALALPEWRVPLLPAEHVSKVLDDDVSDTLVVRPLAAAPAAHLPKPWIRPSLLTAFTALLQYLLAGWLAMIWAGLAVLSLARLGLGMARVSGFVQRGTTPAGWTAPLARAGAALGVRRAVRLVLSSEVQVPMTAGLQNPVLVLPASAERWTDERRELVLLHELAHVKRFDWLALIVCEISSALWWFHPLAWFARRSARRDAELAADDLVLSAGARPSVYAAHLLQIVRSLQQDEVSAMAMGRASDLDGRLRALLEHRGRGPASPLGRAVAVLLSGAALALATVRPTHARVYDTPVVAEREAVIAAAPAVSAKARAVATAKATARAVSAIAAPVVAYAQKTAFALASGAHFTREGTYRHALDQHHRGHYQEAIEGFRKSMEEGEREDASAYNIACAYARLGDKERAFEWLGKAQELGFDVRGYADDDGDLDTLRDDPRFGALRTEHKRKLSAREAERFESLMSRAPKSPEPWYQEGKSLLRAHDYERAYKAFQEAASRSAKPGSSLYNAACALALKGDRREALDELQKAVEAGFDDATFIGDDEDLESLHGEVRFAELRMLAEELALPQISFGLFGKREPEWRAAAARLEAVARAHPQLGLVFYNLGFARLAAGQPAEATAAFQRSIDLGYRRAASLYNVACAEARQGHTDRAFQMLDQAIDAGFDAAQMLRSDDDLDNLRGDPRYRAAIKRADEKSHEGDKG